MKKSAQSTRRRNLEARLQRARSIAAQDADFLNTIALQEVFARVTAANRTFSHVLDWASLSVFPHKTLGDQAIGQWLPDASIIDRIPLDDELENLTLQTEQYDLAFSIFGLHWCTNPLKTLVKIRQSLKPDGLFVAALPGAGTLSELRQVLIECESRHAGGAAMRVDPFPALSEAGALLQNAGFALPVADIENLTLRYDDVRALVTELRAAGTASNLPAVRSIGKAASLDLDATYKSAFSDPDGRIRASINLIFLTGWAPHESQQKALAPGSAQVSLTKILRSH